MLRSADAALSAGEVRQRLGEDLAYTTVVTTLGRLHSKGLLHRVRSGRAHRYSPVTTESGLAARRMRQTLDAEPDREAVLSRFVAGLSGRDETLLRRLLDDHLTEEPDQPAVEPHTASTEG
ncbi:MAG: BlaI/MecI/CopY family transcriptional regulator [Actinomycetota bacterium]|nr:BlaI/MecI/CopY family transcriptional regulator [Actinomycetota bacterium]